MMGFSPVAEKSSSEGSFAVGTLANRDMDEGSSRSAAGRNGYRRDLRLE